jgi:glycosyltransferase involved in cell wall biosynthesis
VNSEETIALHISVLTCTHNPRKGFLERVMLGLANQTFTTAKWEYLLIDNASTQIPEIRCPPNLPLQIFKEPEPGKIHALLKGLSVCRGEMIVIVDDDNVLAPNYLENAWRIFNQMPFLGVWGGSIHPEFEVPPDSQLLEYTKLLTLYEVDRVTWSNSHLGEAPAGAGMCLRREVAEKFRQNIESHPALFGMGRKGNAMPGVDDWEMAMSACDLGLGMGKFPELSLTHLIPRERIQLDYLLALRENAARAYQVYTSLRPELHGIRHFRLGRLQRFTMWCNELRLNPVERMFRRAFRRGIGW